MSVPPTNNPGFANLFPAEYTPIFEQLRNVPRDPITGAIDPGLIQMIRGIAAFAIPQKVVFEDINWTLTIDPKATNLIKLQQKNCVEQIHYWLVKEYDFNIDTCMKIIAFVLMFLTWGITYFVGIGAAMIFDCMQPEPVTQEVRGLISTTLIDPSRATTLPF